MCLACLLAGGNSPKPVTDRQEFCGPELGYLVRLRPVCMSARSAVLLLRYFVKARYVQCFHGACMVWRGIVDGSYCILLSQILWVSVLVCYPDVATKVKRIHHLFDDIL